MRTLRTLTVFWLLEIYALSLVFLQLPGGIRTDEAKYLLSIPYPHPPLLRTIMAWTDFLPFHEFFWRFLFASLCVQAVRFLWDLGDVLTRPRRICLSIAWLLSSALILQAGSIMLAVPCALFGLVFVWLALHPMPSKKTSFIALVWLSALFTTYQSVLFAPLVFVVLLRSHASRTRAMGYFFLPLLLLALYTCTNPLILASMAQASTQDGVIPVLQRVLRIGWVWLVSGSVVLSVAGTVGVITSNRLDLVMTFGLVLGYIVLTSQHYYAFLLTPVLLGGLYVLLCRRRLHPQMFIGLHIAGLISILFLAFPSMQSTPARSMMQALREQGRTGPVLINGYFGHEWQYEGNMPILRFNQRLSISTEASAETFVCMKHACDTDVRLDEWVRLYGMPLQTWTRRKE